VCGAIGNAALQIEEKGGQTIMGGPRRIAKRW